MADADELEIQIDADGNVTIKVVNGKGESCVDLTKQLEEALGTVSEQKLTDDYYVQPVEEHIEQERGGQ